MTFELEFHEKALKEFKVLQPNIREQFKAKLKERLRHPRVPAAKLSGHPNRYKIKLKKPPLRLVYEVVDSRVVVQVIAIGKRDRSLAYKAAAKR
ncbi:type II toxin-antitoxin system RelE/ParE family toxin [Pseudophaeobacter arcticus]|uniref:Type II toxin-antitoxin system RelE/ParE family toxin n=1 Tax=Pseudophaeobacter arcticus TaxID=385492 RepID=A0ABQ0ALE5_9RHOB